MVFYTLHKNNAELTRSGISKFVSYLHLFGLVEEFIVPCVIDHAKNTGLSNITATQALLHLVEEESKHICLFRCFAQEFAQGFALYALALRPSYK